MVCGQDCTHHDGAEVSQMQVSESGEVVDKVRIDFLQGMFLNEKKKATMDTNVEDLKEIENHCLNLEIHLLVNNFLKYVVFFWVEVRSLLSLTFMKTQSCQICLRSIFFFRKSQNPQRQFGGPALSHFDPLTGQYVRSIILKAPLKSSDLDPLPNPFFLQCFDDLVPPITPINSSLQTSFNSAFFTP